MRTMLRWWMTRKIGDVLMWCVCAFGGYTLIDTHRVGSGIICFVVMVFMMAISERENTR